MLSLKTAAGVGVMLFSAIFSYFVEETRVPRENHRHAASQWQTLSYVIKDLIHWIYIYLCLSPLKLWVWISLMVWWFSHGTPFSSINKTDCHDITEILLKVALNTIILIPSARVIKAYNHQ
jgi:hypothetical protein